MCFIAMTLSSILSTRKSTMTDIPNRRKNTHADRHASTQVKVCIYTDTDRQTHVFRYTCSRGHTPTQILNRDENIHVHLDITDTQRHMYEYTHRHTHRFIYGDTHKASKTTICRDIHSPIDIHNHVHREACPDMFRDTNTQTCTKKLEQVHVQLRNTEVYPETHRHTHSCMQTQ